LSPFWRRPDAARKAGLWLAAALALGTGLWWALRPGVIYETVLVARGDLEATVTAIGTLQPRRYVDVGAQVSGQINRLHVQPGSVVAKGDLLVEIDPSVQKATVDGGRAALAGLRARLAEEQAQQRLARQKLERQRQLAAAEATRLEDVQAAEAAQAESLARIDYLKAQIDQTQASLKADEARLGYTRIYAPMDGTVVSVEAREGQTLNATYQTPNVLRIADLSGMTVWTDVSEADVRRVKVGMPVYFTTLGGHGESTPRRWHSKVRQVLPAPAPPQTGVQNGQPVASKAVLYTVLFDVDNPDGELMPQMTAQVSVVTAAVNQAVTVPLAAVSTAADGVPTVRVLVDGEVVQRRLRLGVRSRHGAEVLEGLAPGEVLVTGERPSDDGPRRFSW